MLQRKQTLWLLLALICTALSFKFPFYAVAAKDANTYQDVTAQSAIPTLITGAVVAAISLVAIFLFKNRRRQLWVAIIGVLAALLQIVLLYAHAASFSKGSPSLTAVLPILAVIFLVMAGQGIAKDEKTVRELNSNRLR
jgi:peptidoglycan/LPS O-acetylase OafA/YrhL